MTLGELVKLLSSRCDLQIYRNDWYIGCVPSDSEIINSLYGTQIIKKFYPNGIYALKIYLE